MRVPWLVPWVLAPAILGVALSAMVDVTSLPFIGTERIGAVFLTDGTAYFGHIDDNALTGTVTIRDVYYLSDARNTTGDYAVSVVKRGTEVHEPTGELRIRRDKVLAIEHVSLNSPVARAIAAQRALEARK